MAHGKLPLFSPIVKDINHSHPSTVSIQADKQTISAITNRIQEYKALPAKLRPALEALADYTKGTMIANVFDKEGPGWQPLAKRTQRERQAAGYGGQHPILRRSGDLYKELVDKSHPRHIEVIKVGKNARIEIGGSSSKFIENQLGNTAQRLPARPMIPGTGNIPIIDRDRKEMSRIIQNAYIKILNRPT